MRWPGSGPGCPQTPQPPDLLGAAFPGLRYVWLRRDDTLRQGIKSMDNAIAFVAIVSSPETRV